VVFVNAKKRGKVGKLAQIPSSPWSQQFASESEK